MTGGKKKKKRKDFRAYLSSLELKGTLVSPMLHLSTERDRVSHLSPYCLTSEYGRRN